MKNLQDALDNAHKAAGLPAQRSYELSEHFEEDKPDSVVLAHRARLAKKASADASRRQVNFGMQLLLSLADNIAAVNRGRS